MHILDVQRVTSYLKDLVENDPILSDVWVRGEVSNFSRSAAGHIYFNLCDDNVLLNSVLFKGNQRGILALPRNGEVVLAHGRFAIYEPRGQYQLVVDNVAPEGIGILQLQFEETRRKLEAEGLFAIDRKRPLPQLPSTIGVVTSAHGAVWHDIQHVIRRRFPLVTLILSPTSVQGPNAPAEIVAAIAALEELEACDVIIVGRGGGSAEDLACFSDERVARAIFGCSVPVISAVGHETDTCIADLVADFSAPTPSAAAEQCVPDREALTGLIGAMVHRATSAARSHTDDSRHAFDAIRRSIDRCHPRATIERGRQDVDRESDAAAKHLEASIAEYRNDVNSLTQRARLLNPRDILRRGYAAVSTGTDVAERRVALAQVARQHPSLRLTFADGSVSVTVEQDHP